MFDDVKARVKKMGFTPINVVPLYKLWSVIGIQNGQKFNIQLHKTDAMRIAGIYRLVYSYSDNDPDKIIYVDRRKI